MENQESTFKLTTHKKVPTLKFYYDDHLEKSEILMILSKISNVSILILNKPKKLAHSSP